MLTMYENFTANDYIWHHAFHSNDLKDPLQTTTCFTGDSKEPIFSYSTNPFNLS